MDSTHSLYQYNISIYDLLDWIAEHDVTPLMLVVTGSHAWGTNRPESDLDIRGIYLAPTRKILSLHSGSDTIEATKILGGRVDLQLYEVSKAFNMLLASNGNIVEMLLAPTTFYDTRRVDWIDLGKQFLTKQLSHYYKGFYHSQRKRAGQNRGGKALVYATRELMSGTYLMRYGEIIFDFWKLRELYEREWGAIEILDNLLSSENWRAPQGDLALARFELVWDHMCEAMENERDISKLQDKPDEDMYKVLNQKLFELRVESLHQIQREHNL